MKTENIVFILILLGVFFFCTETSSTRWAFSKIVNYFREVPKTCVIDQKLEDTWEEPPVESSFPEVNELTNVTTLFNTWRTCSDITNSLPNLLSVTNLTIENFPDDYKFPSTDFYKSIGVE
jgi:hypothetical protein